MESVFVQIFKWLTLRIILNDIILLSDFAKVRVSTNKNRKKKVACPARVAEAGLGNIETVHEPEPIQTIGTLCMDRVAVLWKVPMAHKLRYVKEFVPSR
jgi:hypothetical protein